MKRACIVIGLLIAAWSPHAAAQRAGCAADRPVIMLGMDNAVAEPQRDIAQRIRESVGPPNRDRIVLLSADVTADFSDVGDGEMPLITLGRCVTLGSYTASKDGGAVGPGRTARQPGPQLLFGSNANRSSGTAFIDISCGGDRDSEGASISGIRLRGPSLDDQQGSDTGIYIGDCHDVEIANSELSGWGNSAIDVHDRKMPLDPHTDTPATEPKEILVFIHGNFIHNNQHSSDNGHAAGYGVSVSDGAYARIVENSFDNNRHSITSSGKAGGYQAERNLILKGGGFHGSFFERDIHVVDAHGQSGYFDVPGSGFDWFLGAALVGLAFGSLFGPWGAGIGLLAGLAIGGALWAGVNANNSSYVSGYAGRSFDIQGNAVQYKKTLDVKIRGTPANRAVIDNNVFARTDHAAIDPMDNSHVTIGPHNRYDVDTFGAYQVCDIDGDGIDDLFLATGTSWWYSSTGRGAWTFLRADTTPPASLKVGYFDADNRCDVMRQNEPDEWVISSGATGDWQPLGGPDRHLHFGHPLSDVYLGRFDPNQRDSRPGVTRRTTHAFWRRSDGQWFVTPLTVPDWQPVASSSTPWADLRFGDFNGDGVTDVLANIGGHWSVSDSARGSWRTLNAHLNDPVAKLYIGNLDADDNIDDLLKLEWTSKVIGSPLLAHQVVVTHFIWRRSRNGTEPWTVWREYDMSYLTNNPDYVAPGKAFVGRFGQAPASSTLLVDASRYGHFFGRGSAVIQHNVDWLSPYTY